MNLKRAIGIAVAAGCMQVGSLVAADQQPATYDYTNYSWDWLENNSRIALGGEGFYRKVRQGDQDYTGGWGGIYGVYSYTEADAVFFQLDGRGSWGKLDGHGDNSQWNAETLLGYTFGLGDCNDVRIAPFTGIGYEHNQLHTCGKSERLRWWYVPFGMRFDFRITPSFEIGVMGNIGLMFNGQFDRDGEARPSSSTPVAVVEGAAPVVEGAMPVVEGQEVAKGLVVKSSGCHFKSHGKFHNKYRWEIEVPFTYIFCDTPAGQADIAVVPFWHGWTADSRGRTPHMQSSEPGARLELGWRF
jgi:hypothetical protein